MRLGVREVDAARGPCRLVVLYECYIDVVSDDRICESHLPFLEPCLVASLIVLGSRRRMRLAGHRRSRVL